MIPHVEIRNKYNLKTVAIVEPQECWFELLYQEVGEFEIFCRATKSNLKALQKGRYVTLPNKRFIWVITSIRYTFNASGSRMVIARGYGAKWLLSKRCVLDPTELQGKLTTALYSLVNSNLGAAAETERQIQCFTVDNTELADEISQIQAVRGNLLDFEIELLKTYKYGSQVIFEGGNLVYKIYKGADKTKGVRFSQSFDNLLSSQYLTDESGVGTYAKVVSVVDEKEYTQTHSTGASGVDRAEIVVNSNLSTTYKDANGNEKTTAPTSELYTGWLIEEGKKEIASRTMVEEFDGEIDLQNSMYEFDKDFYIGDKVQAMDEYFDIAKSVRITKYTIKQDANGYGEEAEYGEEV